MEPKAGGLKCVGKGAREWKRGCNAPQAPSQEGALLNVGLPPKKWVPPPFSPKNRPFSLKIVVDLAFSAKKAEN